MDGHLLLFVLATFLGGFVSGFSGFAMGIVVSGIWLHIITPIQVAALIAGYGLLTQGYGIARLRHELTWRSILPLTLGTAIGIPIGVILLTSTNPTYVRFGVGVLLVLYATYSLVRPPLGPFKISNPTDFAIGIANGLLGGVTGLGSIISTISRAVLCWAREWAAVQPNSDRQLAAITQVGLGKLDKRRVLGCATAFLDGPECEDMARDGR
ncbi:putative membrane protein YfcA [Bradyrhizobium sp. LB7.2]|uniref:sulfite exporter TauE/SafE family protein n=1 Tax=Bradyrhizobium sp. LB14.3 TaxID=3156328 RepID=UPI00339A5B7D